jgi:hypothetical protein
MANASLINFFTTMITAGAVITVTQTYTNSSWSKKHKTIRTLYILLNFFLVIIAAYNLDLIKEFVMALPTPAIRL